MSFAIPILGGIGLFLVGVWMMTEGLKLAAGGLLQRILASATSSPLRGLAAGIFITALVRSSSAVTVATIGFVNAGLMALAPAVWVVFGTNLGTTTTAWLVVLAGTGFDAATMALPLVGIGMILRLVGANRQRTAGLGQAIAGFGVFFLGIGFLQDGFDDVTPMLATLDLDAGAWLAVPAFVALGFALTVVTQSSSAAIAIALTASAGGSVPLLLAAAAVIGTNIGTTSTAAFAAVGATAPARRVAAAHIIFNVVTAVIALALHNGAIVGYLLGRHADALTYRRDAPRGANLYFYETVPRLYGQFLAYALYRWEIIVRESAIFGILGVRTLGFYIDGAIAEIRLDVAVVLLVVTGGLSMAIDVLSRTLRRRLRIGEHPVRLSAMDARRQTEAAWV